MLLYVLAIALIALWAWAIYFGITYKESEPQLTLRAEMYEVHQEFRISRWEASLIDQWRDGTLPYVLLKREWGYIVIAHGCQDSELLNIGMFAHPTDVIWDLIRELSLPPKPVTFISCYPASKEPGEYMGFDYHFIAPEINDKLWITWENGSLQVCSKH